jgi:hypothetical protein
MRLKASLRRAEGLRRDAQKIAKLEGQLAAITEYEVQLKMRCRMSIDRDQHGAENGSCAQTRFSV